MDVVAVRPTGRRSRSLLSVFEFSVWRMAWRNLGRSRRRTALLVGAAAVGVGGSFLVQAISNGIGNAMVHTAVSTELGHVQIHPEGYQVDPGIHRRFSSAVPAISAVLDEDVGVTSWTRRLRADGLISTSYASSAVSLMGVDPAREATVTNLPESVLTGEFLSPGDTGVVLGEELAARLRVSIGQKVVLSLADGEGEMASEGLRVRGVVRTAFPEFNANVAMVTLGSAQRMLRVEDSVSEFVALAKDRHDLEALVGRLRYALPADAEVRSWSELRPILRFAVEYMMLNAGAMYLTVFIAAAFGIAGVLYMAVHERIPEFGVLASVGMRPGRILTLVMIEAFVLVVFGVASGLLVGAVGVQLLQGGLPLGGVGALGAEVRVVPAILARQLVGPVVLATIAAVVGSLGPAIRAARLSPIEATRQI